MFKQSVDLICKTSWRRQENGKQEVGASSTNTIATEAWIHIPAQSR